jgi:large subunit ribosomal protein L22
MKAILRRVRISPKKANLIAALIRNKNVKEAIDILKFTPKKGALILKKVVESAAANAEHNFKQDLESLYIKEIIVTEGITFKRSLPISRGRMHPILKRTSHITVKVEAKKEDKPKKAATKKEEAPKAEKTEKPKAETKDTEAKEEPKKKPTLIVEKSKKL